MEHLYKTITNNGIPIREVHFGQPKWGGAIFRRKNLLIRKEIDTQPPTAQGKLITLCNEL